MEAAARVTDFDAQPMTAGTGVMVAVPLKSALSTGSGRCCRNLLTVEQEVSNGTRAGDGMNSHVERRSAATRMDPPMRAWAGSGVGLEIDQLVVGGGEVDKRAACADAVENCGNRKFVRLHHSGWPADGSRRPRRIGCIVAVASADRGEPMAIAHLSIPELALENIVWPPLITSTAENRSMSSPAGGSQRQPMQAFPSGRFGMADGCNAALRFDLFEHSVQIPFAGSYAEVDELGYAKDVEVAIEGGHLAPGDQQHAVEVRLQLAHRIVLRSGVVVGDGDEVQPARGRRLHGEKERARNHVPALARATAIAVRGMHVQIAAIPACAFFQGMCGEARSPLRAR